MTLMIRFTKLLFVIALIGVAPLSLLAVTETGVGSNVTATVTPQDPRAGDFVSIAINGYGFNASQSFFTWDKDGKKVLSGDGKNSYSFQLGKLGVRTKIVVGVYSNTRKLAEKTLYFEPTDIDFIWQADSFVPPFYKGKEMASVGSAIKIIATPYIVNGAGALEKNSALNFSWQQDGTFLAGASGIGKNIITVTPDTKQNQLKIDLTVSTADKKNTASKSLVINLSKPELAIYELKPLSGLNYLKQVIGSYDLYEEELSLMAIPYFWPNNQLNNLDYIWSVNGLKANNQDSPDTLTLRQPAGGVGQNEISLQVKDRQNKQNTINSRLNIKFGNNLLKFNNAN